MDYEIIECAVICLTDNKHVDDLVKGLLQTEYCQGHAYNGEPSTLTWNITNKYFDASVKLGCCNIKEFSDHQKRFKQLEAIVFLVDNASRFKEVTNLSLLFEKDEPEVRLLWTSIQCQLKEEEKDEIFTWCIDHQFEFVENEDEDGRDEDIDEGFCSKFGIDRIIEALSSHVWRNHQIKDELNGAGPTNDEFLPETSEEKLFQGGESFEELFGKFHIMKEQANSLQGEARKDYAEKVALAFMEAMGLDDDGDDSDSIQDR